MVFILLIFLISLLIFLCKSYSKLNKDINNMISAIKKKGEEKTSKIQRTMQKTRTEINHKKKKNLIFQKNSKKKNHINNKTKKHSLQEVKSINLNNNKIKTKNKNKNRNNINKNNIINNNTRKNQNISKQITTKAFFGSVNKMNTTSINKKVNSNNNNIKELLEQKDFELNSLEYKEALILDHRTFMEYYISMIKNNHPIFFSFSTYIDYNSRIIKIFLFFFSFSLDFSINALFFNDDTMHKI